MKLKDLKVGDILVALEIYSDRGTEYEVIENHINDVIFFWSEKKAKGYHIFYDNVDDLKFAMFKFGVEL